MSGDSRKAEEILLQPSDRVEVNDPRLALTKLKYTNRIFLSYETVKNITVIVSKTFKSTLKMRNLPINF